MSSLHYYYACTDAKARKWIDHFYIGKACMRCGSLRPKPIPEPHEDEPVDLQDVHPWRKPLILGVLVLLIVAGFLCL